MEMSQEGTFTTSNKHYLCIADYHSKLPVIEQIQGPIADKLIIRCKIMFAEYGIPRRQMSDTGPHFNSEIPTFLQAPKHPSCGIIII